MVNFREVRNESIWRITQQHQQKQDEEEREHTAHEIYIHFSTEGQQMKHYRWASEYSRATSCKHVHKYYMKHVLRSWRRCKLLTSLEKTVLC